MPAIAPAAALPASRPARVVAPPTAAAQLEALARDLIGLPLESGRGTHDRFTAFELVCDRNPALMQEALADEQAARARGLEAIEEGRRAHARG